MTEHRPRISVIIPAYNESARLPRTLEAMAAYARRSGRSMEVVVVDDGSADDTAAVVQEFARTSTAAPPGLLTVRLLRNDGNRGKGYSVRHGMTEAAGELLLLSDADLSTPIEELERLLPWIDKGFAVVIGSRAMADSNLDPPQPWARRMLGWVFGRIRRTILLPHLRDTQCGFKLFTREAARKVFPLQQAEGFAFDCEVLALAEIHGYRVREVGVVWRDDRASTVRPIRDSIAILWSLVQIRQRLGRAGAPEPATQQQENAATR